MPTYDYRCRTCKLVHEVMHGIHQKPRVSCPECGDPCSKMIGSGAGVIFKGPGFHETDYRKPDKINKNILRHLKENAPDDQLGNVKREDL